MRIVLTHLCSLCVFLQSLQKNGQISSMTSLNGHSEDNTLAEGQCVCVCPFVCLSLPLVLFICVANVPVSSATRSGFVCVCVCMRCLYRSGKR